MTVNDLGKKPRYDTKNPHDRGHVDAHKPTTTTTTPDATTTTAPAYRGEDSTQTNRRATQAALGFTDAPKTTTPKGAGAKSAVHGIGVLERTMHKLKRGTLVALAGLALFRGGQNASSTMPTGNPFNRQVTTSMLDIRTGNKGGQRAVADAQKVVAGWVNEIGRDGTFGVDAKRAQELVT